MSSQTPQSKDRSHADSAPSSRGDHGTVSGLPVNTVEPRKKHPGNVYPMIASAEEDLPEDRITDEDRAELLKRKKTERNLNAMTPRPAIKIGSAPGMTAPTTSFEDPPPVNLSELANVEKFFHHALDTLETTEPRVFYCDIPGVRLRTTKTKFVVEAYDEKTGRGGAAKCFGEANMFTKKTTRLGNFFPVGQGL